MEHNDVFKLGLVPGASFNYWFYTFVGMHHDDPNDQRHKVLEFVETQLVVLMNCNFMIKDIAFLSDVTNSQEIKNVIMGDQMFIRVGNIEWSQLIIEFFHLYNHRENYSLHNLLNFSIDNFELVSWQMPDLPKLRELKKSLKATQTKNIAKRVVYIRHKIKAHLDLARYDKEVLLFIDDAKHIYNIAELIVGEVYYQLQGMRPSFEFNFLGEIETTVTKLVEYDRLQERFYKDDFSK